MSCQWVPTPRLRYQKLFIKNVNFPDQDIAVGPCLLKNSQSPLIDFPMAFLTGFNKRLFKPKTRGSVMKSSLPLFHTMHSYNISTSWMVVLLTCNLMRLSRTTESWGFWTQDICLPGPFWISDTLYGAICRIYPKPSCTSSLHAVIRSPLSTFLVFVSNDWSYLLPEQHQAKSQVNMGSQTACLYRERQTFRERI